MNVKVTCDLKSLQINEFHSFHDLILPPRQCPWAAQEELLTQWGWGAEHSGAAVMPCIAALQPGLPVPEI